jgi:hypothetical protein
MSDEEINQMEPKKNIPYPEIVEKFQKEICDFKPKDRLDYITGILNILNKMNVSITSFLTWYKDVNAINTLNLEELEPLYESLKVLGLNFLELDKQFQTKKFEQYNIKNNESENKLINRNGYVS